MRFRQLVYPEPLDLFVARTGTIEDARLNTKFQSPRWWENLRTALKTVGELGIETGIFNCPGWSQSGGPWVCREEAMCEWTPEGIRVCRTRQGREVTCGPCYE